MQKNVTWGMFTVVRRWLRDDLRGEGGIAVEDGSVFVYRRSGDEARLVHVLAPGQWKSVTFAE